MQLLDLTKLREYLNANYPCIYSNEVELKMHSSEFDGYCNSCGKDVFFKATLHYYGAEMYGHSIPTFFYRLVQCPKCRRKTFLQFIMVKYDKPIPDAKDGEDDFEQLYEVYKLSSLPTKDDSYFTSDIPIQYASLLKTVGEAKFCVEHDKNISAAIMFRRAIQIIAKDVLGAPGKLYFNN